MHAVAPTRQVCLVPLLQQFPPLQIGSQGMGGGGVPPVGVNRGHSRAAPGKLHFWAQRECWGVDWNICGEVLLLQLLLQLLGERRETAGGEKFWVYYSCSSIPSLTLTGF